MNQTLLTLILPITTKMQNANRLIPDQTTRCLTQTLFYIQKHFQTLNDFKAPRKLKQTEFYWQDKGSKDIEAVQNDFELPLYPLNP